MNSRILAASLFGLVLLGGKLPASFFNLSPAIPERLHQATSVVVVKVVGIEKDTVTITPAPNFKQEYLVATVKVEKTLKGDKERSEMRVGFAAPSTEKLPPGVNAPAPPKLTKGQEALLILTPLPDSKLEVVAFNSDLIDKQSKTFEKDLKLVEQCMKLLDKPEDGLKSKDAAERFLTARLLINKYRPNAGFAGKSKEAPIDAEESKLILTTLAEGDWKQKLAPPGGGAIELSAYDLFLMLHVTKDDGLSLPKDPAKQAEAAKAWVKDNVGKYRIKRIVLEEKK